MWEPEEIPNADVLFYRVHRNDLDEQGRPKPGAFRNRPPEGQPLTSQDGMSTDWSRYSSAQNLLQRAKTPTNNIIVAMVVGEVRQIPEQTVEHTPIAPNELMPEGNRAHADVRGPKKNSPESRLKFREIATIAPTMGSFNPG